VGRYSETSDREVGWIRRSLPVIIDDDRCHIDIALFSCSSHSFTDRTFPAADRLGQTASGQWQTARFGTGMHGPFCLTSLFRVFSLCPLSNLYCPNSPIPLALGIKPVLARMAQLNLPSFDLVVIFLGRTPPHLSSSSLETPAALLYTFTIH